MTVSLFAPPGHYASPIVDPAQALGDEARLYAGTTPADIDLDTQAQLALCWALAPYCADWNARGNRGRRYRPDNDQFGPCDAALLHAMLAHFRPAHVVEVGCGFSSAVMFDTREQRHLPTELHFIDPHRERFDGLLLPGDVERCRFLHTRVQDVPRMAFAALAPGDVLFIDSSHVSKTGSDVNHLLFEVLPRLAPGVLVHIHDIFHGFEYPREWVLVENRSWNELYLVRAFLMNNRDWEIVLFADHLRTLYPDVFGVCVPQAAFHRGGSLWLRRRRTD